MPTGTTAAAADSHEAWNHSSKNGDCKQTLKDSQLHVYLRAKLYFHKHCRNDSENLVMGPAWKPERRQQHPRHPPDSSPSCKPLAPPKLQVHPWSGGAFPPGGLDTPASAHSKPDSHQHLHGNVARGLCHTPAPLIRCLWSACPRPAVVCCFRSTCDHLSVKLTELGWATDAHLIGVDGGAAEKGEESSFLRTWDRPPHVRGDSREVPVEAGCPGESESTAETAGPFSWAPWGAGVRQLHPRQLGPWSTSPNRQAGPEGHLCSLPTQLGSAHLRSIRISPEAHGRGPQT